MGCGMPESTLSFFVIKCKDLQFTIFIHNMSEIYYFTIYSCGSCHSCQTFADIFCNIQH